MSRSPYDPDDPSDTPLFRRTDPPSSRKAAESIRASGVLSTQRRATWEALSRWLSSHDGRPVTSAELAAGDMQLRYTYARRLPELERLGYARRMPERQCAATGQRAVTWALPR